MNLKAESLKLEIEKEENKFNEQKLKLFKEEMEKIFKIINQNLKMETTKEQNQKVLNTLKSMHKEEALTNLNNLEMELKELKRMALLTQPCEQPNHVHTATNVIRPVSSLSILSSSENSDQELLNFSQKS